MVLNGLYKTNRYKNCTLIIEDGIFHRIILEDTKPVEYLTINPVWKAEFNLRRINYQDIFIPMLANRILEYKNKYGDENQVLLRLNWWQRYKMKKQLKLNKTNNEEDFNRTEYERYREERNKKHL